MTEKVLTLSGVKTRVLELSQADDPARPHLLTFTAEDGTTAAWRLGPLGLRALTNNSPQNIAKLLELAGGEDDEDRVVQLSEESARARRSADDTKLAAIELAAEAASDEHGILDTERVSAHARRYGMTYPAAYQQLRSALSGALRRDRETERRIQNLADERGLDFSDAAKQEAIERAHGRNREPAGLWFDRSPEERDRLLREEAERHGYR